ncbi:type II toxin-antitoxin system PrlF family antitoxin [Pectobacterium brasiliense]|uniref:type II toxin-antitoxin system PrlF family antitoxin n=1 Tax=Pectobacterium brasiliense TaxID=180957 RepID=UPI00094B6701|nr:type II toxin-antitoxin system PrlF family antitoxin [Pectobacterium brasiliense]
MFDLKSADVLLRADSRLTARSQTTIPSSVRDAMNLQPGEYIHYSVLPGGQVLISRREEAIDDDPVIHHFLHFLAEDMQRHPENIKPFDQSLMSRASVLTAGMDIDLDAPLTDDE